MQLKFTLSRGSGLPDVDLMVDADPETTVGDLAQQLARSDPDAALDRSATYTLSYQGVGLGPLRPDLTLLDSGLRSGSTASIAANAVTYDEARAVPAAAILRVLSGPDEGKEFPLSPGTSLVGRGSDCDVRLSDPMTSRRHAKIHVSDTVVVTDVGSANGVLVDDLPVDSAVLRPGERACLGDTVISVSFLGARATAGEPAGSSWSFVRRPRINPRYAGRTFALPEPPSTPRGQRFPIIPLFAPLLMGAALYLTTKSTTSLIFMGMSPLMMLGNVVEGQLAGKRNYRRDLTKFRSAVSNMRADGEAEADVERSTRRAEFPSLDECAHALRLRSDLLWSRRPDQVEFGQLRLGTGVQASRSKFDHPFGRQGDLDLLRELHDGFDQFAKVSDVPVVLDLDVAGALGVAGPRDWSRDVARGLVAQMALLHSPAEMVICATCLPETSGEWEWLKWLPHCYGQPVGFTSQMLASTRAGYNGLLGELDALVTARSEGSQRGDGGALPRVLVLLDEPPETERGRLVDLAERGPAQGVWVIWVSDDRASLPSSCKTFVERQPDVDDGLAYFSSTSETLRVEVERLKGPQAEQLGRQMSPLVDASARDEAQSDVPRSVSLVKLVGGDLVSSPEGVIERWIENRSLLTGRFAPEQKSRGRAGNLRAVIGEGATGPHALDLRVHGPHALVGGTTGAGKSELLQSWIIGMALSNSPQRLTFLLVDYKGGSAFSECVHLPHTVGLVTDLSPHLVRRALTSLSAELRYREHVLHRKQAKDLASLERDGDPEAPPSLVIVVDEFAALVKEVPEFVDGVVNVAQRGRSLGLHLILATQRPSGVIRDNLRANTNLRIALRMADAGDSSDVIGTPAAAGFDPSVPGRAASRTGPTALIPFQTGYVGGWTSDKKARPAINVTTLGFSTKTAWELPSDESQTESAEGPTDIQRLVSSIGQANRIAGLEPPRKPWLAELASAYDLAKLPSRRRDDELVFAVADDPARQQQPTIAFRPDDDGNMAIFGTGNSGKSTLLRTLAVAAGFTVRGGPCNVYGLDFGARGLQMLEQLPHVGSIIAGSDTESVSRLLTMLRELIDSRAAEYSRVGAGSITQYRKISGNESEPRIMLLVDGMGAMRTAYEGTEHHRMFESFMSIAADGRQVGVHVLLAADRAGAIPSALSSLIQRRVVLRLAGENDYAMLGQPTDVLDSRSPPGRGLCDGLEIQVAILGGSPDLLSQDMAVRAFATAMVNAGTAPAPKVRKLPEVVGLDDLETEISGAPTFALSGDTLLPRSFATSGTFSVAGPPGSGRTTALLTLCRSFRRWRPAGRLVYFGSKRSPLAGAIEWTDAAFDPGAAAALAPSVGEQFEGSEDSEAPGLVVIENLVEFVQTEADPVLQDMIKKVLASGNLVISDGEPMPLSGLQPLVQAARSSRVGIVLQPEQTDGALFRIQFPRVKKADFPPGRGLYVARGEQPAVVQVAQTGSAPH